MDPVITSQSTCLQYPSDHTAKGPSAIPLTAVTATEDPELSVHTSTSSYAPPRSFAHTPPSYHSQWSTYSKHSPSSSNPLTPIDGVFQQQQLDISELVHSSLYAPHLMTPKQTYGYRPDQTVSNERNTAETPSWPPSLGTNMLPPLRPHDPQGTYYYPQYTAHHTEPYIYTPKHDVPAYGPAKPYSYAYHQPANASTSSQSTELVTPNTTEYPYTSYGTIQPSAFGAWSEPRRDNGLLSAPQTEGRQPSPSSIGDSRGTGEWTRPSPAVSRSDEEDELVGMGGQGVMMVQGNVQYTSDSEIKQTKELKRMCYNCHAIQPPSWRKSLLYVGKILCNKCGIYERTHHRARPQQDDEHKLRRGSGGPPIVSRGSKLPSRLQVMREDEDDSPLPSPYSAVPSQTTSSAYAFPPHVHPAPTSYHSHSHMPPPSTEYTPPNSTLVHRRHSQAHMHEPQSYARRQYHSLTPGQTHTYLSGSTYDSHVSHGSYNSHGHGQSSPYAHAYARRPQPYTSMSYGPKVDPLEFGSMQVTSHSLGGAGGPDPSGVGIASPVDVKPSIPGWDRKHHHDTGSVPGVQLPEFPALPSSAHIQRGDEEEEDEGDEEEEEDEENVADEDDGGEYRPGRGD